VPAARIPPSSEKEGVRGFATRMRERAFKQSLQELPVGA
jgi:hypothetical protein